MNSKDKLLTGIPSPAIPTTYAIDNMALMKPDQFIVNVETCFEHYHFAVPSVVFCGFVSQSHFSISFKKRVGVTPSTYLK